jgi:putative nucleotidyltransferase with HDIG domain
MITEADIEELFRAQLGKIEDAELRAKVVRTWVLGCERGGWDTVGRLKAMPFTLLVDCANVNFIEHTVAVTEGAYALARVQLDIYPHMPYKVDLDRLVAGGLLHDVGKLLEIESQGHGGFGMTRSGQLARHPISGTWLASEVGLPEEVLNCIACHAAEGEGKPKVVETIFIRQADFATFDPLMTRVKGLLVE